MKSKVLSLLLMLTVLIPGLKAQQLTPLPLNPEVKSGVLPNGLTYFILHNEEPKERANFYIAQKVGSTLETPDQLGLAHFLEHMAFNGTKTYPGKNMLNYLQSKGIRFGADINAYTGFDETVYNINNIPTKDVALMDSVLLVLRDWSGSILLEESEIDAERGVIHEEWRQRNDAQTRMYTTILPDLYEEYQYEQMPIGKMDIVMNFKPEVLRAYYKKWYRPDQQGVVIVGDFDVNEMEKKVVDLFSAIPMPENAAPRTYPEVSNNVEPIYTSFEDPELQNDLVLVAFKYDKTPFEYRNTFEAYVSDVVMQNVMSMLINNRLTEYVQNPDCKFAYAGVNFGDYFVSKTKGAFNIVIVPKGDVEAALADAAGVIARACKTGFTDSELERVNSELLASYEKMYNERNKTDNDTRANELIRHFIDNEPTPGIEAEYDMIKSVLPMLPAEAYNQLGAALLTPENQVIVVSQHKVEGRTLPAKDKMVAALNGALNAQYEAYVDEVITDPLIAALPAPGTVASEKSNDALGTKELTLSNGVRVIIKSTDFASDAILLTAYRNGGKRSYEESQAADVMLAGDAFECSKLGEFDVQKMKKYLAGKKVALGYEVNLSTTTLGGQSTVKDLPTLFELIYAAFTELNPDKEYYTNMIDRYVSILANQEKNPMYVFRKAIKKTIWGGNPMMEEAGLAQIQAADYDKMFALVKESLKNAADYTFVFTGNINADEVKPLLCQYLATLPSTGVKTDMPIKTNVAIATGKVENVFTTPMETPSVFALGAIDGEVEYNLYNDLRINLLADVLDIIYTNTLREEEGGTYGAQCSASLVPFTNQWMLQYFFQTNPEMRDKLINRAALELSNLLKNGADAETFNKVKEAALAQYDINVRTNDYWDAQLVAIDRGYDLFTGYREMLQGLTLEDFNKYLSTLYNGQNSILVVEDGAAE